MTGLIVTAVLTGMAFFIWLGYECAKSELSADRADVEANRRALDLEWAALENVRLVNDVLFEAQDELRRAATVRRRSGQRR